LNEKISLPTFIDVSYVHDPYLPHEVIVKCKTEQDLLPDLLDKKVKYPGIELVIKFLEIKGRHYTLEMERALEHERSIGIVASLESPKAFAKPSSQEIVSEQVEPSEHATQNSSENEKESIPPAENSVNPLTKKESKNDLFVKVLPEKRNSSEFVHQCPPAHIVKFLGRDIYTAILFFITVCSMATTLRCCKQKKDPEQLRTENEQLRSENQELKENKKQFEDNNKQLHDEINKVNTENELLKKETDTQNAEIENLKERMVKPLEDIKTVTQCQKQFKSAKDRLESLNNRMKELKKERSWTVPQN
jgi:DNA repair exonuclease SbcCD ATPase subunit